MGGLCTCAANNYSKYVYQLNTLFSAPLLNIKNDIFLLLHMHIFLQCVLKRQVHFVIIKDVAVIVTCIDKPDLLFE